MSIGFFGSDEYGDSPYGGLYPPFGLESAISLSPSTVRVRFTAMVDYGLLALTEPGNYQIMPGLTVLAVLPETAQSVILVTVPQDKVLYTIVIQEARGFFQEPLDPLLDTITFEGDQRPSYQAVATGPRRIRAIFSTPMLDDANLIDPSNYTLTDLNLNSLTVLSVVREQATAITSVVLTVDANMADEQFYQMLLASVIVTADEMLPLTPPTSVFQWVQNEQRVAIPLSQFSGEVTDPLFGIHNGLVFFSPSLLTEAPDSVIQIDEISVCTKAYDEYRFPQPIDPKPLFTHGAGVVPTPDPTLLNSAVVWASFPRLVEAKTVLSDLQEDTIPAPVDDAVTVTFTQAWDLNYVSLLNNTEWKIFDNGATPPEYFMTANNSGPIPPGPTVYMVLGGLSLDGDSEMTATATVV